MHRRRPRRPTKADLEEKIVLPTDRDPDEALRDLLNVKVEHDKADKSKS